MASRNEAFRMNGRAGGCSGQARCPAEMLYATAWNCRELIQAEGFIASPLRVVGRKAGYAHMDFTAVFLYIKEAVSKRLPGHSIGPAGALRAGLARGSIAVVLTLVLFVGYAVIRGGGEFEPGRMRQCDSPFTRDLLTKVVNESIAGQRGVRLLQVDEVADFAVKAPATSGDPQASFRNCSAFVRTNAGRAILFFQMTWGSPTKDEVWLEITESSL